MTTLKKNSPHTMNKDDDVQTIPPPCHTEDSTKGAIKRKVCSHLALLWNCRLWRWPLWCTLSWVS